jgi:beta-lactamase class A
MQSVFKLPLVITVLHAVEQHKFSLDQNIRYLASDRILPKAYSPLQDKYPDGEVDITLRELLRLSVSLSDNVAADILLRLVGGPTVVDSYIRSLGIQGFHLEDGEHELHRDVEAQYRNWFEPAGAVQLLRSLSDNSPLSKEDTALLFQWMESSRTTRIKADLPQGTIVRHKAGTSGVENGIAFATNDIGLVVLPNGKSLAIAVFVTDARASEQIREGVIARIAKAAYDEAIKRTPK